MMEKQRSTFSMKQPLARLVVFSLTLISCFLVSLSFYFIWVIKATPPFLQQTHFFLGFNPLEDISSAANSSSSREFTTFISNDTNLSKAAGKYGNITLFDSKISGIAVNYSVSVAVISEDKKKQAGDLRAEVYNGQEEQDVSDATSEKPKTLTNNNPIMENGHGNGGGACDVTKGKWVFDDSYPLYTNNTCPYIDEGFNCEANGRMDKDYMKWRWQPQDCNIPRFNATKMLELIRGKRLVFVGDSLNRNQWESMLCLLMGAIKDRKKVYEARRRRITNSKGDYSFKFVDYKCTVEYYVTHFLVHESKARIGKKRLQTLRIDTIDKGSSRWKGADILVFNTAHWWSHHKTKAGINYYQEGDKIHPRLEVRVGFRRALTTWGSWVDKYVNPRKTRVFFRSSAPSHFSGGEWNSGGHCKEAFKPTNIVSIGVSPATKGIVEEVIRQMKTPVTYLNITELSSYRKDGHPSIYGRKSVKSGVQDCSHWCLPGVPDLWNELLYYHLNFNLSKSEQT